VAHNKFLAKLASDARKPDGLFVVDESHVRDFLDPMPVARLWGIGKRTAPRLQRIGILTVGQLRRADPALLAPVLGKRTEHDRRLARGEDDRPVVPERADKSISREETFDVSLGDRDELLAELQRQTEQVARRLRSKGLLARTVTVKIRDDAFRTVTRSCTMVAPTDGTRALYRLARALFERWRTAHPRVSVRLLGMGVSSLQADPGPGHDPGDAQGASPQRRIDAVLDRINERFGEEHAVHGQTMRRRRRD
jgi:DNA polymerase-4